MLPNLERAERIGEFWSVAIEHGQSRLEARRRAVDAPDDYDS